MFSFVPGNGGANSFGNPIYQQNGQTVGGGSYRLEDNGGSCAYYKNIYNQNNVVTNATGLICSDPMLSASTVSCANDYMLRSPPAPLSADIVGAGNSSYEGGNTWMTTPSGYNSFGYEYANNTGSNHSTFVQPSYFYNSR